MKGDRVEKQKLLSVCKERESDAIRHHREYRQKAEKASVAIIEALCNIDDLTLGVARNALKIATEILEDVSKDEIIS